MVVEVVGEDRERVEGVKVKVEVEMKMGGEVEVEMKMGVEVEVEVEEAALQQHSEDLQKLTKMYK